MIEIADLRFGYPAGGFQLEIPSMSIAQGETVALIGHSGTGKTTLLNLISGVVTPADGRVITKEVEVSKLDDAHRRNFRIQNIGFVFQEFELLEYLSVLDNMLLPCRISPALELDHRIKSRAQELAEQVGIANKLRRFPGQLSQGERQRVAICRSLLTAPPIILADEPTGNLDPENTDRVLDILFEYVQSSGATLIGVTHERHYLDRFDKVIDFAGFRKEIADA